MKTLKFKVGDIVIILDVTNSVGDSLTKVGQYKDFVGKKAVITQMPLTPKFASHPYEIEVLDSRFRYMSEERNLALYLNLDKISEKQRAKIIDIVKI